MALSPRPVSLHNDDETESPDANSLTSHRYVSLRFVRLGLFRGGSGDLKMLVWCEGPGSLTGGSLRSKPSLSATELFCSMRPKMRRAFGIKPYKRQLEIQESGVKAYFSGGRGS